VVMYDGRVVQVGSPEELFETPAHTFVGYFIGSPGMNFIDAAVTGSTAQVQGAEVALATPYDSLQGRIQIGIRPEYCTLTAGPGLPVTVQRVEDVGRHRVIRAQLYGQPFNIIAGEDVAIAADATRVSFQPEKINVYSDDWRVAPASKGAV
jgi:glycerol transport system ATP-binding protein